MKSGPGSRGTSAKKAPSVPSYKKISAGSKSSTSAKTVKATVTPKMAKKRDAMDKAVLNASRGTAYRNLAKEGATKKGGMPVYNSTDANRLRLSKKSPRSNMT
jgi:hypothetical protein